MAKITITIDDDNVTVNQSAAPTKMEKDNKKFFIIMREEKYEYIPWVEFVTDDYIKVINKLKCYKNDEEHTYKLYVQTENEIILPCNFTDYNIDK